MLNIYADNIPFDDKEMLVYIEDTDDNSFTIYGCSQNDALKPFFGIEDISEIAVGTKFTHENLRICRLR